MRKRAVVSISIVVPCDPDELTPEAAACAIGAVTHNAELLMHFGAFSIQPCPEKLSEWPVFGDDDPDPDTSAYH